MEDFTLLLLREDLKKRFYLFFRYFWDEIEDVELSNNWHIEYLCDELQVAAERVFKREPKEYDICVNISPGTTKSRIFSIMFPVWCWINKPQLRIITASYSGDLAKSFCVKSKDIIKSSKFKRMFPELAIRFDRDEKTDYENNFGGERYGVGFSGTATGKHADIIIIDDPLKADASFSETERRNAARVIGQTLSGRKRDKKVALTILVMQRLHEDDPTKHFTQKKKIKHICLPAELTDYVKPESLRSKYVDGLFDPNRLDRNTLDDMKAELGSFGYSAQALQNPIDSDSQIFNPRWWQRRHNMPELNYKIQTWDTAFKEKSHNDYSVCGTWGIDANGYYLIEVKRYKLSFPDLLIQVKEQYNKWQPDKVLMEDAASAQDIIPSIKRETKIPVFPIAPMNKIVRAHAVSPIIESGQVYIIDQGGDWIEPFISEHAAFPNGAHDDQVDVTTISLSHLRKVFQESHKPKKKYGSVSQAATYKESKFYDGY
jgi:predicted phage terminase large subunit-like protein